MIAWNPVPHVRHAWSGTNTIWGKIALVLFYSFIWVGIVGNAWFVLFPDECFTNIGLQGDDGDAQTTLTALMRSCSVMMVGFLLYADVGGLQVKNVAMVAVFVVAAVLCLAPSVGPILGREEAGCVAAVARLWIRAVWIVVALLFAVIDDKMADSGTEEENASLTV